MAKTDEDKKAETLKAARKRKRRRIRVWLEVAKGLVIGQKQH